MAASLSKSFLIRWQMAKFVTFEENVRQTMQKTNPYPSGLKGVDRNEILGYKIIGNKIMKVSDYKWDESDWERYLNLLSEYKIKGHLDRHRFLIMAAWNQVKGRQPRSELF